jgi:hypothetical protein
VVGFWQWLVPRELSERASPIPSNHTGRQLFFCILLVTLSSSQCPKHAVLSLWPRGMLWRRKLFSSVPREISEDLVSALQRGSGELCLGWAQRDTLEGQT